MRVQNVNTDILRQAAQQAEEAVWGKFPQLDQWIEGLKQPTLKQLARFAKAVHLPFGYFFLKDLPRQDYPIPHYRTLQNTAFRPSAELRETLYTLQERQAWAKDILLDLGQDRLPFGNAISTDTSVAEAVKLIAKTLGLRDSWAHSLPRWADALRLLVDRAERAGIFVVINGVVGNNTQRSLSVEEFRGFVLYDDYAPFVFINGKDAVSGKIFTLVHEIVHVLLGVSASFDLDHLQAAPSSDIEIYCDKVAAEFLVPALELKKARQEGKTEYQQLALHFKVSQIVIARRMLDLGWINRQQYGHFYDRYLQEVKAASNSEGGNFYNTAPYRISRRFFELMHKSVRQNNMLYTEAFRLTGLKPHTFEAYTDKHL